MSSLCNALSSVFYISITIVTEHILNKVIPNEHVDLSADWQQFSVNTRSLESDVSPTGYYSLVVGVC